MKTAISFEELNRKLHDLGYLVGQNTERDNATIIELLEWIKRHA